MMISLYLSVSLAPSLSLCVALCGSISTLLYLFVPCTISLCAVENSSDRTLICIIWSLSSLSHYLSVPRSNKPLPLFVIWSLMLSLSRSLFLSL